MFKKTRGWIHDYSQVSVWRPKLDASEYAWKAAVHSQVSDVVFDYYFATREQARGFKKATELSMTSPIVMIYKVPMPDDRGYMPL